MMCKHCGKQIKDVSRGVCAACGQAVMTGPTGNGFYDILTENQTAVRGGAESATRNEEEGFFVSHDLMTELINTQKTTNKYLKRQTEYKRVAIIISIVAVVVAIAFTISFMTFNGKFEEANEKTTANAETEAAAEGKESNEKPGFITTPTPSPKSPEKENDEVAKENINGVISDLEKKAEELPGDDGNREKIDAELQKAKDAVKADNWEEAAKACQAAFKILSDETSIEAKGTKLEENVDALKKYINN